jgi:DNA-binding CsgD family transcriptional regulator
MVVIDAEKHKLDYRQSELDNGIAALKKRYQSGGASTLISRAKSQQQVDKRQGSPKANIKGKPWYDPNRPEGALIYTTADDVEYTVTKRDKKTGKVTTETRRRHDTSTRMAETDDAYTLISDADTPMERAYADYANKMKAMANQARVELHKTGKVAYSASAKSIYEKEVKSLNDKLDAAELNRPKERKVQLLARAEVDRKQAADPSMTKSDVKKAGQQAVTKYRSQLGAKRNPITITDKEWEAIQAGAISETILKKILKNTDTDNLRERATPRSSTTLSAAKINKLRHLRDNGATLSEIAKSLGVSTSTVSNYLKGEN